MITTITSKMMITVMAVPMRSPQNWGQAASSVMLCPAARPSHPRRRARLVRFEPAGSGSKGHCGAQSRTEEEREKEREVGLGPKSGSSRLAEPELGCADGEPV